MSEHQPPGGSGTDSEIMQALNPEPGRPNEMSALFDQAAIEQELSELQAGQTINIPVGDQAEDWTVVGTNPDGSFDAKHTDQDGADRRRTFTLAEVKAARTRAADYLEQDQRMSGQNITSALNGPQ